MDKRIQIKASITAKKNTVYLELQLPLSVRKVLLAHNAKT
jgi:hypothetical protein